MVIKEITYSISRALPGAAQFEMYKPMISATAAVVEGEDIHEAYMRLERLVLEEMHEETVRILDRVRQERQLKADLTTAAKAEVKKQQGPGW